MNKAVSDKSELLQQLKIDRSQMEQNTGSRGWPMFLLGMFLSAVACISIFWWLMPADSPQAESGQAQLDVPAVNVAPKDDSTPVAEPAAPRSEPGDAILNSSGYITARRMATVSAEIMGLITEVNVEEGMEVREGQVLARLDSSLARVGLELAEGRVEVLKARSKATAANLDEARRNHERIMGNEFSSEAEKSRALSTLENLTASLESARADTQVAMLEVRMQQERLEDHTIRAPFAGVVTVKNAQTGEIVAPTSAGGGFTRTGICTIVDMNSLEIEVDVNESFIGRVYSGQPVAANLDAYPDWTIPASVIAIIPTADRAKATVQVRIKIEQQDPRILPDMGVKVAFLKS